MLHRASRILALLPVRPLEFLDRVTGIVDHRLDRLRPRYPYRPQGWDDVVAGLAARLGCDRAMLGEEAVRELEAQLEENRRTLEPTAPYPFSGCGDVRLGRLCYLVCRALKPELVVETGVLYGVTSAYVLKALATNGRGLLHSIDLPPARDGSEDLVGCLVPSHLRSHWRLHRGASRRLLPDLLPTLPSIDVFIHDSLHTFRNMRWEFQAVDPYLAAGAVVISDDVEGNAAFGECYHSPAWPWAVTLAEEHKKSLLGVAVREVHARSSRNAVTPLIRVRARTR